MKNIITLVTENDVDLNSFIEKCGSEEIAKETIKQGWEFLGTLCSARNNAEKLAVLSVELKE